MRGAVLGAEVCYRLELDVLACYRLVLLNKPLSIRAGILECLKCCTAYNLNLNVLCSLESS